MATINDIVLIYVDNKPSFYARIEDIAPDVKPNWWQVSLLALTFPLQMITWILDEYQIEGAGFTMGGTPMRLEPIISPVEEERLKKELEEKKQKERRATLRQESGSAKVVSLADRRKR